MKIKILTLICFIPLFANAQSISNNAQVTWTQNAINFYRFDVTNPTFDSNNNLLSFPIIINNGTKCYQTGGDQSQYIIFNLPPKSFDLIKGTQTSVTADGITVTYAQLAQLIVAASAQINPLPAVTPAVTTNNAVPPTP